MFHLSIVKSTNPKSPNILGLTTQVQVHLGYKKSITISAETRSSGTIGCTNITRSPELPNCVVSRLTVSQSECICKFLGSDAINVASEETVGQSGTSTLDTPKRFFNVTNTSRWTDHNLENKYFNLSLNYLGSIIY